MPHYKDQTNKLHWIDGAAFFHLLPEGSVEITDEEAEVIRLESLPPSDPAAEKKLKLSKISQEMISSGVFEVFTLVAKQVYFDKVKALPEAAGLTDEQIHQALINPISPYYNLTYARVHAYNNRLEGVD